MLSHLLFNMITSHFQWRCQRFFFFSINERQFALRLCREENYCRTVLMCTLLVCRLCLRHVSTRAICFCFFTAYNLDYLYVYGLKCECGKCEHWITFCSLTRWCLGSRLWPSRCLGSGWRMREWQESRRRGSQDTLHATWNCAMETQKINERRMWQLHALSALVQIVFSPGSHPLLSLFQPLYLLFQCKDTKHIQCR